MTTETFNYEQMEAALCVWEHVCEHRTDDRFKPLFEGLGSPGMRDCAIPAADIVLAVYHLMESRDIEYCVAFDFEFVPDVCTRLDWPALVAARQYRNAPYEPDIAAILDSMIAASPDSFHKRDRRAEWYAVAKHTAADQWCYPDLLTDHPEAFERAFNDDEDPRQFTIAIGEKYGLTPRREWRGY